MSWRNTASGPIDILDLTVPQETIDEGTVVLGDGLLVARRGRIRAIG